MSRLFPAAYFAVKNIPVFPVHSLDAQGNCSCSNPNCQLPGRHAIDGENRELATLDLKQIITWWKKHPHANIGIPTGRLSGWYVIELTPGNGVTNFEAYRQKFLRTLPLPSMKLQMEDGGAYLIYGPPKDFHEDSYLCNRRINQIAGVNFHGDSSFIVVPNHLPPIKSPEPWLYDISFYVLDSHIEIESLPTILIDLIENGEFDLACLDSESSHNYLLEEEKLGVEFELTEFQLLDAILTEVESLDCPPLDWDEVLLIISKAKEKHCTIQCSHVSSLMQEMRNNTQPIKASPRSIFRRI